MASDGRKDGWKDGRTDNAKTISLCLWRGIKSSSQNCGMSSDSTNNVWNNGFLASGPPRQPVAVSFDWLPAAGQRVGGNGCLLLSKGESVEKRVKKKTTLSEQYVAGTMSMVEFLQSRLSGLSKNTVKMTKSDITDNQGLIKEIIARVHHRYVMKPTIHKLIQMSPYVVKEGLRTKAELKKSLQDFWRKEKTIELCNRYIDHMFKAAPLPHQQVSYNTILYNRAPAGNSITSARS
ncbi:hypothetical protein DPMN_041304 [Dreissena polymorpha]|uniref:Uncharacterized protein n=1 Tax=Dreissena polymorpha TaxID=45954 RepID=A0A9D4CZ64_DREPO|nr:hypothetical protein DPMN_041304 [Dreissena polymorpha]